MKKNYVYFLAPVVGLVVFAAVYWNFSTGYEAKLAQRSAIQKQERDEKLRLEAKAREQAIKDAVAAQEKRKAEKAAKEAKEKADADYRQSLVDARTKANREQFKLSQQVTQLERDVKVEKEAIAKLEETRKAAVDEQNFLKTYVRQAEVNTKSLSEVLDKISAADAARALADAQAAKSRS